MDIPEDWIMQIATIKSEQITGESGEQETRPVIPFSEFPRGRREAGPDADGNLVWTVHVEE